MSSNPKTCVAIEEVIEQLEACTSMPDELIEIFSEEASEHLQTIYDGLNRLGNDLSDMTALGDVRRASHTLKGAAGAVDQRAATRLAHRMEDLLDRLAELDQAISQEQLELLLSTADQLQELTSGEFESKQVAEQIVELYQAFEKELGKEDRSSCGSPSKNSKSGLDMPKPVPDSGETEAVNQTKPDTVASDPVQYLRVPLDRLDDMAKLFGDMIVNRSEFQHRLQEFESRIADMQNALQRLRSVSHHVEELNSQTTRGRLQQSAGATESDHGTSGMKAPHSQARRDEFDPLEFEHYSEFYLLSQTLSEADNDAEIMAGEFEKVKTAFDSLLRRQQQLNREAQKCLLRVRMVPLGGIANRLERTVRTVSKKLQRKVELQIVGQEIELDKTVLDEICDPILHLIRNAIDHGVEDANVRRDAGKSETAQLQIQAINHGTQVTLKVSDDGGGINLEKIKAKASELGLIDTGREFSDDELHAMIFHPGFSTASELTDVSGRGIGMDVVSDAIRKLKGTIRVDSQAGIGTTFTIQIPTMVGVSRAVFLESGGQQFAIPMQSIHNIQRLSPATVDTDGEETITRQTGSDVRLIDLASHLHLRPESESVSAFGKANPMLMLGCGDEEIAITVDTIIGCRDIVVKTLGNHLQNVRGVAGATIVGDGSVVPILDSADFFDRKNDNMLPDAAIFKSQPVDKKLAMVVDDSISVRRVTENLLRLAGWHVVTAKDGVDALERLSELDATPDIFLCDMEMPRMDGIELVRQIRDQEEFQCTPIVMVTSRASEKHRHKAFDAGATEYVVKPYDEENLLELISSLVDATREMV